MTVDPGSFRDPKGYIFFEEGEPYRKINPSGVSDWLKLKTSGLLTILQDNGLLIRHTEVSSECIKPEKIPFISYPQEWSFSQYKDAALLTLDVALHALEKDFILKDASAYNVQFIGARPVFIDTLSFEPYPIGSAWVAYKQFCQHFLAPLALMSKVDISLSKLLSNFIDGIPLSLASKLLPKSTYFNLQLLFHIHLHARAQDKYANAAIEAAGSPSNPRRGKLSRNALLGLLDGLRSAINALDWNPTGTEWGEYYSGTNYSEQAMSIKGVLVAEFVAATNAKSVWDLGANTGVFSHIAAKLPGVQVISFDIDPAAVEKHYRFVKKEHTSSVLPLVLDLTSPTPSYGWAGRERQSIEKRGPTDAVMALALIHHLAISNNIPLKKIAEYFRRLGKYLIIEFVPKSDSQVKRLLATREDIFPDYTENGFKEAFGDFYEIQKEQAVSGSERTLYLLSRKSE